MYGVLCLQSCIFQSISSKNIEIFFCDLFVLWIDAYISGELLDCIDEDARAFEPLSRAYSIPKDDPTMDEVMEECLRNAAGAPLHIFDITCECIELVQEFAAKGSKIVISDAATGVAILKGAMYGAAVNVKVNTKLMKDKEYAASINKHVDDKMDSYSKLADEIFSSIYNNY